MVGDRGRARRKAGGRVDVNVNVNVDVDVCGCVDAMEGSLLCAPALVQPGSGK